tara:strand:+ start:4500 stop:5546 length:1047 start_codon:yes stop_codon:yes gene_type:complete
MMKLKTGKPITGRVPARYWSTKHFASGDANSITEARTWVEFYPQNCWKDLSKDNLTLPEWNGKQSLRHLKGRVQKKSHVDNESDFIGADFEELQKLMKVGDMSPPVMLSPTFGNSIVNLSTPQKKRRRMWLNEEDGDLLPERYVVRDPQLFYAKRRVEGKKHRTNLVVVAGGNCNIKAKTIQIRAKIYAKIIDELQRQGHNVGVHCVDPIANHNHDNAHWILWEVKRHDEQMTIPQLQRDLGHSAIYRTGVFDMIAAAPKNPRSGLGYTATKYFEKYDGAWNQALQDLIETLKLELGEPTIVLNLLPLDSNLKEEDLTEHLAKIKKQLNTLITQPKHKGVHIIQHNDQ